MSISQFSPFYRSAAYNKANLYLQFPTVPTSNLRDHYLFKGVPYQYIMNRLWTTDKVFETLKPISISSMMSECVNNNIYGASSEESFEFNTNNKEYAVPYISKIRYFDNCTQYNETISSEEQNLQESHISRVEEEEVKISNEVDEALRNIEADTEHVPLFISEFNRLYSMNENNEDGRSMLQTTLRVYYYFRNILVKYSSVMPIAVRDNAREKNRSLSLLMENNFRSYASSDRSDIIRYKSKIDELMNDIEKVTLQDVQDISNLDNNDIADNNITID
ncbi:hypothetical protein ApNV_061 [Aratus pisonii nudivirus]|nr:hypothetical protein ApNV_061 [Aratus pisonii nudivirus]